MRALLVWLLMAGVAASLDRHPWTEATEAEDGCFVVETNTFPEVAKEIAAHLRRAQVFYEDRFGPLEGARPMRLVLFRTRDEYLRFGEGVSGAVGHFDGALDRCALIWDGTLGETGWPVAVHEAAHHWFRRRHPDARPPSWYGEGIACHFEGLLDPLAEDGAARLRVRAAQAALEEGEAKLDLLLASRAQVRTGRLVLDGGEADAPGLPPTRFYGLAWSLVHFLATDARYKSEFRRFEMRLFAARPHPGMEETLARTLLAEECGDLKPIEERWHEHIRALAEPKPAPVAPVYGWELASKNPYVRYGALRRLGGMPLPKDLRPGVLLCLQDTDLAVRAAACRSLAGSMGEDAVAGMMEALDLGDADMKDAAMRALAFPGATAAVPRLLEEKQDRLGALRALATIGDARSNHLLAAALEDPLLPAGLRARCAETLAKFAEATPHLRAALADASPAVRTAARTGLDRAATAAAAPAPPLDPSKLKRLLAILEDPSVDRRDACKELGRARAEEALPALKRLCRVQVEERVRLEAARALVAITGETRGFEPGQGASAREAAYRAWAEE
jgi:HEAT repeat protein